MAQTESTNTPANHLAPVNAEALATPEYWNERAAA